MGRTRKEMKSAAKAAMRGARPGPLPVTLAYGLMLIALNMIVPCVLVAAFGLENVLYLMARDYGSYDVVYYYLGPTGAVAYIFVNILTGLFGTVLSFGYLCYSLRVSRGESVRFGNLLDGFGIAGRVILLNLLTGLFTFLWSLLLFVPGIIAAYRYRMACFILLDDPDCGALEAIRRSKAMMAGHKANLFLFDLSFLNWLLPYLGGFALGGGIAMAGAALEETNFALMIAGMAVMGVFWVLLSLWVVPFVSTSQAAYYDALADEGHWWGAPDSGPDVSF